MQADLCTDRYALIAVSEIFSYQHNLVIKMFVDFI